jgi:hypothetical protein
MKEKIVDLDELKSRYDMIEKINRKRISGDIDWNVKWWMLLVRITFTIILVAGTPLFLLSDAVGMVIHYGLAVILNQSIPNVRDNSLTIYLWEKLYK